MAGPVHLDKVLDLIDPDELTRLTADLVRLNSVWDPQAGTSEHQVGRFVASWAETRGFQVEVDQVAPGRPNVIVTWTAGPQPRTLLFEAHSDVVTPGDPAAWTGDPFEPQIVGRRMYGRGTNDTKGNLAAMLLALAALKRARTPLFGTIVAAVLCDEEDRMLGVLDFIRRGRADRLTGAVICEPQDGLICTAQKGALRATFSLTGRMSHGAMPLAGLNPAPAVARLIEGLQALEDEAVSQYGPSDLVGWPSFTPTVIRAPAEGPAQLNVVPGRAEVLVDVRTVPGQPHLEVADKLKSLAAGVEKAVREHYREMDRRLGVERNRDLSVTVEITSDRPHTLTDREDPLVQAAHRAVHEVTGADPRYGGVLGATDGTFLWSLKHVPIVTMGAGARDVAHQADEWVDLDQLTETARVYALTAFYYLGGGG
ncbi:MAG: M20/M25/M40 family metallo-hydrolase [Thermodesulfobacteriota bacterium]